MKKVQKIISLTLLMVPAIGYAAQEEGTGTGAADTSLVTAPSCTALNTRDFSLDEFLQDPAQSGFDREQLFSLTPTAADGDTLTFDSKPATFSLGVFHTALARVIGAVREENGKALSEWKGRHEVDADDLKEGDVCCQYGYALRALQAKHGDGKCFTLSKHTELLQDAHLAGMEKVAEEWKKKHGDDKCVSREFLNQIQQVHGEGKCVQVRGIPVGDGAAGDEEVPVVVDAGPSLRRQIVTHSLTAAAVLVLVNKTSVFKDLGLLSK